MQEHSLSFDRQQAIKELISEHPISDQNQIVDLLRVKYGIKTNQTVISRDLRKLGVIKKMLEGTMVYEMAEVDVQTEIFRLALVDIDYNETMIVIKTHPGLSAFVGDHLDQFTDLNILGCLAGENVVFIVPKKISEIAKTFDAICKKLQIKNRKKSKA
jgi:transcriptional regulator of arginine metabolism